MKFRHGLPMIALGQRRASTLRLDAADAGEAKRAHCVIVRVTVLLSTPLNRAVTLIVFPGVAEALIVPVPLPLLRVSSVVSELIQVTEVVTSCGVLTPGKVASAVNVTMSLGPGLGLSTCNIIDVGVPGVTVTLTEEALTVPKLAPMVVVQMLATDSEGLTRPLALIVAQSASDEVQVTRPVRSLVLPSS